MRVETEYTDYHATIFIASEVAGLIEAMRRTWDPIMAAQIDAHVTLVYPQEVPTHDLLVSRLRTARLQATPFRLRLGRVAYFGCPDSSIYIAVEDVDGGYQALRQDILRPPCHPIEFPPHVTLVHPRTSSRGRDCWEQLQDHVSEVEFAVSEVTITACHGRKWDILETFILG